MKKLLILTVLACTPFLGTSQSILDRFEDADRIGSVTINRGMLDIVATMMEHDDDPDSQEFIQVAKSIDNIKIFLSEDEGAAADMAATMAQYVRSSQLEELMKVKDGDTHVRFYVRQGRDDNHVEELLMFVTGIEDAKNHYSGRNIETVLLTMTGDIDLTKVGTLANKMKLHKGLEKLDKE